ncbi:MAG: hypothetical protein QOG50_2338 [Actinomycetota bacterium]|nr:hypothetical protein [Actinomycetota bacterium]
MVKLERRRSRAIPVVAAALVALGWCSAGVADAAISPFILVSSFTLAPTSGPPGTVVNVSGKDCSPEFTNSASSDYVAIEAPTLQVNDMQIPVHKKGSWHGSFRVPAGASTGVAAPVAALCFTDTLPSLTTWYTPQTFTVTAPAPTTTTRPTTTTPGTTTPTTPTTNKPNGTTPPTRGGPSPDGGGGSGSTGPAFGGFPPGTSGGNTGGGTDNTGSDNGGAGTTRSSTTKRAAGRTAAARAADLSVPELPAARVAGASGLGWLSWLLLLALIVATVGTPFWLRRSRRSEDDDTAAVVGTR